VTRVTVTPGRDQSKPLVEIDPDASHADKAGLWALRGYLALVAVFTLALVVMTLVFLILFG
jgi:hypothetical protein